MTAVETIEAYFAAMRRGDEAAAELLALFTHDAYYSEPFSGLEPVEGVEAIRERFELGWEFPLPDLELDVLDVRVDGTTATSEWECRSSGLAGPVRGTDRYEFRGGRIARLEVVIDPPA